MFLKGLKQTKRTYAVVFILSMLCVATFAYIVFASGSENCGHRLCIIGSGYTNNHYDYYYSEWKCPKFLCGEKGITLLNWTPNNSSCSDTCVSKEKKYCDEHDPCGVCNESKKNGTHYDKEITTTVCPNVSECGWVHGTETTKKDENTATTCSVSRKQKNGDLCGSCTPCGECGIENGKVKHLITIVNKYKCGHTKEVGLKNVYTGVSEIGYYSLFFGPCRDETVSVDDYCGGDNDQDDPCLCPLKPVDTIGNILDLRTPEGAAWSLVNTCSSTKGGVHTRYVITVNVCSCGYFWDLNSREVPTKGECKFNLAPIPTKCEACFKAGK